MILAFRDHDRRAAGLKCREDIVEDQVISYGVEMKEGLSVVGRPGELTETKRERLKPDFEAGEAVDMQVEWDEPVEEMENRAKPRVSARANVSELLGRVARLEKAVTRVCSAC